MRTPRRREPTKPQVSEPQTSWAANPVTRQDRPVRADGEAVQVDHHRVAAVITQDVPDARVALDDARRQDELKPGVQGPHLGQPYGRAEAAVVRPVMTMSGTWAGKRCGPCIGRLS